MLPAVLLAADLVLPGSPERAPWWRRTGPWLLGWGLALGAVVALRAGVAGIGVPQLSAAPGGAGAAAGAVAASVPGIWATYLRLLVFPWPSVPLYTAGHVALSAPALAGTAACLGACLAVAGRSSGRAGLFGILWIFFFLLPVSGVVTLAAAPVAERFLYLPSMGWCAAAGVSLAWAAGRVRSPRVLWPAVAAAALAGVATSAAGAGAWRDAVALFETVVARAPGALSGHLNLSRTYHERGRGAEALRAADEALRLAPGNADAHFRRGLALDGLGHRAEAAQAYRRALDARPSHAEAANNLGTAALELGQPELALEASLLAVRARPDLKEGHNNLGIAYFSLGRQGEAIEALGRAIALDPTFADAYNNLGTAYGMQGRFREAAQAFREALRLRPAFARAHYNLGLALLQLGDRRGAEQARRALEPLAPDWGAALGRHLGERPEAPRAGGGGGE